MSRPGTASRAALVAIVVAVLSLTLWPLAARPAFADDHISIRFGLADFLRNVLLFLPLGIALGVRRTSFAGVALRAALLSAGIEAAQLFIPGRFANLADLASNTAGALLGAFLHRTSDAWLRPSPRAADRLAFLAACGVAAVVAGTGILLGPSLPHTTYYAGRTLELGHLERYTGRVTKVTLGDEPLPDAKLPDSERVRTLWLEGAPLRLELVGGRPAESLAPIFTIHDDRQREILLIGAERGDLVLRVRTRAQAVSLDRPGLRWVGALDDVREGKSVAISARREGNGWCVTLGRKSICPLGFTVGSGWRLLWFPQALPGESARWLGVAWMVLLALPLGLWLRPTALGAVSVAFGAAALRTAPLFGLLPTRPIELGAAAGGLLLGIALHVALGRRREGALALGSRRSVLDL